LSILEANLFKKFHTNIALHKQYDSFELLADDTDKILNLSIA